MNLIEELKNDHQELYDLIRNIKKLGVHTMEGRNVLCDAKEKLLDHLKKEDEQLYPILNKYAENDPELKKIINSFKDEMDGITSYAEKFFRKYSLEGGGIDFLEDYKKLLSSLSNRIEKEETELFIKYLEIFESRE